MADKGTVNVRVDTAGTPNELGRDLVLTTLDQLLGRLTPLEADEFLAGVFSAAVGALAIRRGPIFMAKVLHTAIQSVHAYAPPVDDQPQQRH